MNLTLCIVTASPALCVSALGHARRTAAHALNTIVFANGCEIDKTVATVLSAPTNLGCIKPMHQMYEYVAWKSHGASDQDLIVWIHDDVEITEPGWDQRIMDFFQAHPKAMVAGFGGGTSMGEPWIYDRLFEVPSLVRHNFQSNMRDAEIHGRRTTEPCRIATLDSFAIVVRRSFLDKIGGWGWWPYPCHGFDNAISCLARRHGVENWLIPIACHHLGGETSTKPVYLDMVEQEYGGENNVYQAAHRRLYDEFRDVLPFDVEKNP